MAWQTLPATVWPVLPGTVPVLRWLAEEQGISMATHHAKPPEAPAWLDRVAWDERGLAPAIAQEVGTNDVLMVAWMNREALLQTWWRGQAVYWSRSRQRLWHKGEESGHVQTVHDVRLDCDQDVILLKVTQHHGVACHTGRAFLLLPATRRRGLADRGAGALRPGEDLQMNDQVLARVADTIAAGVPRATPAAATSPSCRPRAWTRC